MSMFCYQCQETAGNQGCTVRGVCGKTDETANLQDLLIFLNKGISVYAKKLRELGLEVDDDVDMFVTDSMFRTITNANFDNAVFEIEIARAFKVRSELEEMFFKEYEKKNGKSFDGVLPDAALWKPDDKKEWESKAEQVGVMEPQNEDIRSLKELITYGIKGMAAYAHHAAMLGKKDKAIFTYMQDGLAASTEDLSVDELLPIVMKCGEMGVNTMALLDEANTSTYGHPEPTEVNIGVGKNPGILISGHDLKDMEELLKQTKGTGVDVYTHSEMLPANYYPAFKKYSHFFGNYGGAWHAQAKEFDSFNGPILMTTNCIVPPKESYKNRLYTTGTAGYEGVTHLGEREDGKAKDFSVLIEQAKKCEAPTEIETGTITGGFAHNTILSVADKVIDLIKQGKIKKFMVMGGCDGRYPSREYYTDFAKALPKDAIILTAGCAKYRYNKLPLGDIEGIPRVLDAGQCNDSYSLAYVALKLKEALGLDDINELPISYNIAWYEQKAVLVLLALLYLGVKKIHLGPTLPAFLSPNVAKVLVEMFDIAPISSVDEDVQALMN